MSIEQNIAMLDKYGENAEICPDCKMLMSPQAKRCMKCRRLHGSKNMATDDFNWISRDRDFKKQMRDKIRELAKEQGVSLESLGLEEDA